MTKINHISCVLIVKNAEATLYATLDSLQAFEDVVVYSNNSTDNTDTIAASYENVHLIHGDFIGFGPTKNRAAEFAKNDWILSLDADEVLSESFIQGLSELVLDDERLYTILRVNYYKNQQIKHCWGDDVIIRLYNRKRSSFTQKKVHEKIIKEGFTLQSLSGVVQHYPYSCVSDFVEKLERYSTIYAQDNVGKKSSSPSKAIFNALFSFFKTYILKRGFLDGSAGLLIAFSHMATNFYKYFKLYELNQELKSKKR